MPIKFFINTWICPSKYTFFPQLHPYYMCVYVYNIHVCVYYMYIHTYFFLFLSTGDWIQGYSTSKLCPQPFLFFTLQQDFTKLPRLASNFRFLLPLPLKLLGLHVCSTTLSPYCILIGLTVSIFWQFDRWRIISYFNLLFCHN